MLSRIVKTSFNYLTSQNYSAVYRNSIGIFGSYRYAATKSAKAAPQTFKPRFSTEEVLTTIPETQVSQLNNGLKVASENSGGSTCTVGLWLDAGSRYEDGQTNGTGHFLEHLLFKGASGLSQAQLEKQAEERGAQLNAYTGRENIALYVKCLSKDVPWAVDLLGKIVKNREFDDQVVERERQAVLRELQDMETNFTEVAMDYLHQCSFQGTQLARSPLGVTDVLKSVKKQDLVNYLEMHFKAPRMVLASAGGVSHEQLGALAQKYLSGVSAQYTLGIPSATPSRYTGSELRMRDDDVPLAYLAFAVQGCAATSPDYVPLLVARDYVGRWERSSGGGHHHASKLVQALVDYDNRALSFNSFNLSYSDTGLWGIQFVADRFGIDDAITEIQKNWLKLATGSSDFEVERAKNQLKTNLALQLEGTTPVADEIGRHVLLYGRRLSLQELFTRIDLVDSKQVREVGLKYIYDKCPAIAAVGPIEDLRPYNRVRGNMWWFRY